MNNKEFVMATIQIMHAAISGLVKSIKKPPGRDPALTLKRISQLYNKLDNTDKAIFVEALTYASEMNINNLLLMLDGALAIEDSEIKGYLELFFSDGKKRTRINQPEDSLSEIFRSEI